jgi:hypothetical protein
MTRTDFITSLAGLARKKLLDRTVAKRRYLIWHGVERHWGPTLPMSQLDQDKIEDRSKWKSPRFTNHWISFPVAKSRS